MPRTDYQRFAEKIVLTHDHAALTDDTTVLLYKVPAGRTLRIDRCAYVNPTGLAVDGTNAFAGTVKNGSTVVATLFNTDSGDAGSAAIDAATWIEGTLSVTPAELALAAGDVLSVVFDEDGAATLPIGRLVVEGRLF